jgi:formate hydrogenlyase transcriptional activator
LREAEEIAERKRAEEATRESQKQLARERERLQLVLDFTNTVAANLELQQIFQETSASLRRAMRCDSVSIFLPDAEGKTLRAIALDQPAAELFSNEADEYPIKGTALGKAFLEGKAMVGIIDATSSEAYPGATASDRYSSCALPLIRKDQVLGVLALGRRSEEPFEDEEVDLLSQLAKQLAFALENALTYEQTTALKNKLAQEKLYLEAEIRGHMDFQEIVGTSPSLLNVLKQVDTVATTDSTVLILGETGTGKELIARAVHNHSRRKDRTFVKLNCGAIPTGLLESELFGHEKGSFTGAIAQRIGRLELADQGTLFLDEIGDISLELQSKLLRALQEREFERLGSSKTRKVDVRLIAATNRDLQKMVSDGQFRSDLYYRLNVFPIRIPPLRERTHDIPLLVRHFSQKYSRRMEKNIDSIPSNVIKQLEQWQWPGNIRELENFIERAVILTQGTVLNVPISELAETLPNFTEDVDSDEIIQALKESKGQVGGPNGAATRLGMKRTTLVMRMKKLGINPRQWS